MESVIFNRMKSSYVGIIDIGLGNIGSVIKALQYLGAELKLVSEPKQLSCCHALVMPGVGSFPYAMRQLSSHELLDPLRDAVLVQKTKILGICLGFQLFGLSSTEGSLTSGLGFIPAHVTKLSSNSPGNIKVPHIGFNTAMSDVPAMRLFSNRSVHQDFYFVHSYAYSSDQTLFLPSSSAYTLTTNGQSFISSYEHENIFGAQFHPEKSQANGLGFLDNFLVA